MGRGTNTLIALAVIAIVIVLAALFLGLFTIPGRNIIANPTSNSTSLTTSASTTSTYGNFTGSNLANNKNVSQLFNYTLGLINKDRAAYGLKPVSISLEPSGQQHASSMLRYSYFSHWDIYGMKPYMRYTLLGGSKSMDENIAIESSKVCTYLEQTIGKSCRGSLNVTQAIAQMEYNMMYNDSACCNNGHRDNILNPNHNEVSLGLAFNASTIFLVEDFIDDYIAWNSGKPSVANNEVSMEGQLAPGYSLSSVIVAYDPPVANMSRYQLNRTSDYGFGKNIAGVVSSPNSYYPNVITIVADKYTTSQSSFAVSFNIGKAVSQYGAGEYTIGLFIGKNGQQNNTFVASSYTIFINQNGQQYIPQNI